MVIPWARSSFRASSRKAYSNGLAVRSHNAFTCSSFPSGSEWVSASSRPMIVLLPWSTCPPITICIRPRGPVESIGGKTSAIPGPGATRGGRSTPTGEAHGAQLHEPLQRGLELRRTEPRLARDVLERLPPVGQLHDVRHRVAGARDRHAAVLGPRDQQLGRLRGTFRDL